MAERIKVGRTRQERRSAPKDFHFTKEMVAAISGNGALPAIFRAYRHKAWEVFETLPIPSTREEAWRRTNLQSMPVDEFRLPFQLAAGEEILTPEKKGLLKTMVFGEYGGQILQTPFDKQVELNADLVEAGVIFADFETAQRQHSEILANKIGSVVNYKEGKFAALASALSQNGVLLYVPRGVQVEKPIQNILWGLGKNLAIFSHIFIWLEDQSSATFVHEAFSPLESEGHLMHAGIIEIHVGNEANLRFVELQSWGRNVWNINHERAEIGNNGKLDWIFGAIGSHLTKNFMDINLTGQGSSGRMSGFYFTDGNQHLDHDTQQNHLAPNTSSDLLFKGALIDHSRSVWQGMIYVAPGAQKTDGYQANRNLILDRNARADSIPGLEILADDVRCTHGATVGKIDPEQVFYLRSRGIPYKEAERLIVKGFFDPIMQRIPFDGVRERFQKSIQIKMGL